MTDNQAETMRMVLEKMNVAARDLGMGDLPKCHQRESEEDESVSLEWISDDCRIGINIEIDPAESGWHYLIKKDDAPTVMEWGHMPAFDAAKIMDSCRVILRR